MRAGALDHICSVHADRPGTDPGFPHIQVEIDPLALLPQSEDAVLTVEDDLKTLCRKFGNDYFFHAALLYN